MLLFGVAMYSQPQRGENSLAIACLEGSWRPLVRVSYSSFLKILWIDSSILESFFVVSSLGQNAAKKCK